MRTGTLSFLFVALSLEPRPVPCTHSMPRNIFGMNKWVVRRSWKMNPWEWLETGTTSSRKFWISLWALPWNDLSPMHSPLRASAAGSHPGWRIQLAQRRITHLPWRPWHLSFGIDCRAEPHRASGKADAQRKAIRQTPTHSTTFLRDQSVGCSNSVL